VDAHVNAVVCESCGHSAADADAFCEACGTPLRQSPDDHTEDCREQAAVVSDVGNRRSSNQDAFALCTHGERVAVVVCDGVSSTPDAERAAVLAARAALAVLRPAVLAGSQLPPSACHSLLDEAVQAAQSAVSTLARPTRVDTGVPSTTLVAAIAQPGAVAVVSVGDSRAYWVASGGTAELLTRDDSQAGSWLAQGADPASVARLPLARRITRWVGADAEPVPPGHYDLDVTAPGNLVLCSDGLWQYFSEAADLASLISRRVDLGLGRPDAIARDLVRAALRAGGGDNVTVAVVPVAAAPDTVVPTTGIPTTGSPAC
jgi:serine/threonine protein phosphatase PrpC